MERREAVGWLILEHFHKTLFWLFLVSVHFEIDIRRT
jgi:hypothetical protein